MEYKEFKLTELKTEAENGVFTGYLAVFNNRDLGGDIIKPGAFTKTLKEKNGRVPLLDSHNSSARLGFLDVVEDEKGLKINKGVLNLSKPIAQDAYSDLVFYQQNNLPLGLSIGFDVVKREYVEEKNGTTTRVLSEVALWEGSIVTFPMNPKARVRTVKDFTGLTKDEAIQLMTAIKNVLDLNEIKALLGIEDAITYTTEPSQSHSEIDFSWLKQYQKTK